ncbi:MAG TPA: hypothetical protein VF351_07550 [Actinomycetota bacterium]
MGQGELDLIARSGYRRFPPRLPHQPIFYPVLSEGYATKIARDWNTKDAASGFAGYVTSFAVTRDCFDRYEVRSVGGGLHQELWVPAEELSGFNDQIVGRIEIISEFRDERT